MIEQPMNTKGAANYLGCTENWMHKLVQRGKVKAYVYSENGLLIPRESGVVRQGQGLYFFEGDLRGYKPEVQRRPRGSKNKQAPYKIQSEVQP